MPSHRSPLPARRGARLLTRVLLGAAAAVLLAAAPAGADPAGPSDYRSEVTAIVPPTDAVEAEIRGGDSFLELRVEPGHTVVVTGYSGEPYLRFAPDGTVERNVLSEATYLNEDRTADVEVPEIADNDAEPQWETVDDDGSYAWHDHRVHWMGAASPRVERGERIFDPWVVPIVLDGQPVEVQGTLTYAEAVTPLPWIALAVVVAAGLGWLGRRVAVRAAGAALASVALAAVVVGRDAFSATPDAGASPLLWVLPAVAAVAALAGVVLARSAAGVVAVLASVASLSGWALLRFAVLLEPVLPGDLPAPLDRATVALSLGVAVAGAYLALTSGALGLPELAPDDEG